MSRRVQILVCEGPTCGGCKNSPDLTMRLRREVDHDGLRDRIGVAAYLCLGRCRDGPNVLVRRLTTDEPLDTTATMADLEDDAHLYTDVQPDGLAAIVRAYSGDTPPRPGSYEEY